MTIFKRISCKPHFIITVLLMSALGSALTVSNSDGQEIIRLPNFTIKQVQSEIDKGSPEAFYILATLYFKGQNGVELNYQKSADLFRRAAEQGVALAQMHLGEMYYDGTKIPQNDAEALRWYQVAALQGLPKAESGLAEIYAEGRGTAKNLTESARWYKRAAMQGYGTAQHQIGVYYANGTGVKTDLIKAYKWLSLASAQGVIEAIADRDETRRNLSKDQISMAQRTASIFNAIPHYNTDELKRQKSKIVELARKIQKSKK